MKEQVILLGNGINDVTSHYKWKDLVDDLIEYVGLKSRVDKDDKPFPLLYEEIYLKNLRHKGLTERELKLFIGSRLENISLNTVHLGVASLGVTNILTTNYDYAIENAFRNKNSELKNHGVVREDRYSVFRHTKIKATQIWHIHGEINSAGSIVLGHEQYSGQLQHIRNYVIQDSANQYKHFKSKSLITLLKKKQVSNNSWVDLMFTKDIHIIGLRLDFVEFDLWWLITYRARSILEKSLPVQNRITYYYPRSLEPAIKSKLQMLVSNEINTVAIGNRHDESYYNHVLDVIQKKMR